MKLSKNEVEHVANLSKLILSEKELEKMTGQLDNILSYVDKLGEIDTSQVEPTTHVFAVSNAFREDEVKKSLPRTEAVKNGPQNDGEMFQVPRII